MTAGLQAFRGELLHFRSDPDGDRAATEYIEDGLLLVQDGRIADAGPCDLLCPRLPSAFPIVDLRGHLLMPGFIDTHVHYPQTDVIASPGEQLLDWLERYTFPAERRFADPAYATATADFFLDELLRNGTTTALVYGTAHRVSAESLFERAAVRDLRLIAGKALMDRNCPEDLQDTAQSGYNDSRDLIERWHGHGRLGYAITPRFAGTSSEAQLASAGRLAREYPDVFIQSHVAENLAEVEYVLRLFPKARSYLDVYDSYGLLRNRAVYGHCIHLDPRDRQRMAQSGAIAAFCPSSNLFLGSGLFDLAAAEASGMHITMASDIGAGTSLSMLQTLAAAYKVSQLRGHTLHALHAFYLATRGAADVLGLSDHIGSFQKGCEADFVVLDLASTPLIARRMQQVSSIEEKLFLLMMLGDDRAVSACYVMGRLAYSRTPA